MPADRTGLEENPHNREVHWCAKGLRSQVADAFNVVTRFENGKWFKVPSSIRCVAFDAVGTLIYPLPSVAQVYWDAGRRYGSQQTVDQVKSTFHRVFRELSQGENGDYSTSEAAERKRWRQIVGEVLHDASDIDACFAELHAHFGRSTAWRAFPDVEHTLRELTAQGIGVLAASNFDERLHPVCDELPELQTLKQRVISATIGWYKPSPRFYEQVIAMANCDPGQILMVGDDFDNDVAAARAAGLQALWIDRQGQVADQTITDLRQLIPLCH